MKLQVGFVLVRLQNGGIVTQVVISDVNIRVTNSAVLELESDVPRTSAVPLELDLLKACLLASPGPA